MCSRFCTVSWYWLAVLHPQPFRPLKWLNTNHHDALPLWLFFNCTWPILLHESHPNRQLLWSLHWINISDRLHVQSINCMYITTAFHEDKEPVTHTLVYDSVMLCHDCHSCLPCILTKCKHCCYYWPKQRKPQPYRFKFMLMKINKQKIFPFTHLKIEVNLATASLKVQQTKILD